MRHIAVALVAFAAVAGASSTSRAAAQSAAFTKLADEFWDAQLAFDPSAATEAGIHRYDDRLQDLSQPSVRAWVVKLHDFDKRLAAIDTRALTPAEAIDLATVRQQIQSSLVFFTVTRGWRRRPRVYMNEAINSIYLVVKRDFAPAKDRLASVSAREEQ
ncbi:MAG TPA: DUF885 family protein, partial [Polyangia bacterium]